MSTSLKAFLPVLSKPFGLTPIALYGRQVALERAGLLGPREGKGGPGSGIRLTAETAAMMLIALLASDSSDPAEAAAAVAKLKCTHGECRLTGKAKFAEALAAILGSEDLRRRVDKIEVVRTTPSATISYGPPNEEGFPFSEFLPKGNVDMWGDLIATRTTLADKAFHQIAAAVGKSQE